MHSLTGGIEVAEDWIKMRTDLYRDPKVIVMADHILSRLGDVTRDVTRYVTRLDKDITRCAVVGALVSVWGVMRHQGRRVGDDLVVDLVTPAIVDDISGVGGMGEAMAKVGWLADHGDTVVFPKFFRDLNAQPIRSTAAERQKKYRERRRNGDVTRDVTRNGDSDVTQGVTVTGEKRERREENKYPPNPPTGGVSKSNKQTAEHRHFAAFWTAYPRKTAKPNAAKAFARIDPDDATFAAMLAALDRQRRSPDWCKDGGQFIPHPATWLNGRRWEDVPPEPSRPAMPAMSSNNTPYEPYENFIPKPRA